MIGSASTISRSTMGLILESKNIHHFSRFTYKCPSIAERIITTLRSLLKKPVFEKGNADWLSELPTVSKQYKNTIHNSAKIKPIDASKKAKEKEVCTNLGDYRENQKTKI